ncbi:MAG: BMC domain-containing protein [Acidobacteriota bacterium]|nr:BMC domain-containing protein [Acidobacteriota bacterium]
MDNINNIGIMELGSLAAGYRVEDALLKTAPVSILIARPICSGKFLIVVAGSVASVKASLAGGIRVGGESIIEHRIINNLHPAVLPALGLAVEIGTELPGALGIVETFSAAAAVEAADAAVKNAPIGLFRIHLAMAMGGKGLVLFCGGLGDVRAGLDAAVAVMAESGMLAGSALISAPSAELLREYM